MELYNTENIQEIWFDPCKLLKITDKKQARSSFMSRVLINDKQEKMLATIAYDAIQNSHNNSRYEIQDNRYKIKEVNLEFYLLTGDLPKIQKLFNRSNKNQKMKFDRSPLYICSRSGYLDCVKYLLECGCDVNQTQIDGSTSLHVASFYQHIDVVKLLLSYGASFQIRNKFGNLAGTESPEKCQLTCKKLFDSSRKDPIFSLFQNLCWIENTNSASFERSKNSDIIRIYKKNNNREVFFSYNRNNLFTRAFHGTHYSTLESIFKLGLRRPGERAGDSLISVRAGHIGAKQVVGEIENWGEAVFVTPSPFYACNSTYSEKIVQNGHNYFCIIEAFVRKGSFTEHKSTTTSHNIIAGEPMNVELRVAEHEAPEIYRVQEDTTQNVIVYSVLFIKESYLNAKTLTYDDALNTIQFHQII